MEKTKLLEIVTATPKGAFIRLEWERDCKTRKGVTDSVRKHVAMVGRAGIDYDHQKAVQEKRASGELPATPQPLPWGEWEIFPFFIKHNGQRYLRLYASPCETHKPEVQFLRNGQPISLEEAKTLVLSKDTDSHTGECFCCKVEDVLQVHHVFADAPVLVPEPA